MPTAAVPVRGGVALAPIPVVTEEGFRHMTRTRNTVLGLACLSLGLGGLASPALAQQAELPSQIEAPVEAEVPSAKPGLRISLGLGAAYLPDYEGSNDYKATPLWSLRLGNLYDPETYVSLVGTTFRSNFIPSEHWRLGVTARFIKDYDNVEDDEVKNVTSTEKALMLGGTVGYDFITGLKQDAALELDALGDALHGNGYTLTPRFRFRTPVSDRLLFETTASGTAIRHGRRDLLVQVRLASVSPTTSGAGRSGVSARICARVRRRDR